MKHTDCVLVFLKTGPQMLLLKNSFTHKHMFKGLIKFRWLRFHTVCTENFDSEEATVFKVLLSRRHNRTFLRTIEKCL
ncbi:uncharacterized protein LOC109112548 [Arapaima gigas]